MNAAPSLRTDVVALYVDPRGPYPGLVANWYDEARDARTYAGPLPVVAHPPCGPWSSLAHLSRRPQDKELFSHALTSVRELGGIIEHPSRSGAWAAFAIPVPGASADAFGGFTLEVEQVSWGHVARKKTWLYFVGVDRAHAGATIRYGGTPTHWCSGFRTSKVRPPKSYRENGCAVPPGIKVCSAQQRRRTPPAFAAWLLDLAAQARRSV